MKTFDTEKFLFEELDGIPLGLSLPDIHKHPAPRKVSWFDKSRGQVVEIYGTQSKEDSTQLDVFLHTVDILVSTLYKYATTVSSERFGRMIETARNEGLDALKFPELWSIIKP
jgi:ADP-glucose pyrophosphorylase